MFQPPAPTPMGERYVEAANERDELRTVNADLRIANEHLMADLHMIGSALHEEAGEREWCSEYDEFVDGLIGRLKSDYRLPVRDVEYHIRFMATMSPDNVSVLESAVDKVLHDMGHGSCDGFDYMVE